MSLNKIKILDLLFWLSVIFYLDPAGWFRLNFSEGRFTQVFFFLAINLIFLISYFPKKKNYSQIFKEPLIKFYNIFIIAFLIYWVAIYCYLNTPLFKGSSSLLPVFRTRRVIMELFIVYPIYYFTIKNGKLFLKYFYVSTIIILGLYLISVFFSIDIVEINKFKRSGDNSATRNLLYGYGILPFGLFFGVVAYFLPVKKNKISNGLILAGVLVSLLWIFTIARREIIGIFTATIITLYLINKIFRKNYFKSIRKSVRFVIILLFLLLLLSPSYITATKDALITVYSAVFDSENSSTVDVNRISLTGNTFIINEINERPLFGTGYTQKWYVSEGDKEGYEGSDYIFLSTFAQNGIVGLFVMFFYYILIFKIIRKFIIILRKYRKLILSEINIFYPFIIIFLSMAVYYIRHMLEFPNWFYPFGAIADSPKFFIALGLMLGAGEKIKQLILYHHLQIQNRI